MKVSIIRHTRNTDEILNEMLDECGIKIDPISKFGFFKVGFIIFHKMLDEIWLKCIKHRNRRNLFGTLLWSRRQCRMKCLMFDQTSSNTMFSSFSKILNPLECIQNRVFTMLDEMLDAFSPTFRAVLNLLLKCNDVIGIANTECLYSVYK